MLCKSRSVVSFIAFRSHWSYLLFASQASDVWSLGCILYEMVHGKTPFATLHFIQKLQAIINPNHTIEYSEDADGGAIDAIKQCLRRNPEDRPPIVGEGGLLNEHRFLHSTSNNRQSKTS
jgi:serine/threonine-protein kinase TTK/MPS1